MAEGVGSNGALNLLTAKAQSHRTVGGRVETKTRMSANLQLSAHSSILSETHSSSKLPNSPHPVTRACVSVNQHQQVAIPSNFVEPLKEEKFGGNGSRFTS